ncbi:hypothetical protein I7I53_04528 [Histoplasma capsulatum var. duboisii H88]|uniref:Uncharacterized protein n=1 Tax=Ajellomyces capsulatus (strain H88) TaxID=544711 RepID=A0A8A1LW26_AJEC8|nr:hypothetical protein I7I53_04528 [Histoplasma capsulatum var. duboisii H88]
MDSGDSATGMGGQGQSGPAGCIAQREHSKRPHGNESPNAPTKKTRISRTKVDIQNDLEAARKQIKSLESSISRLKGKNSGLSAQNIELQKEMMSLREERNLQKMDDNDIRYRLRNLMNTCRDWAQEYSVGTPFDLDTIKAHAQQLPMDEGNFIDAVVTRNLNSLSKFTYGSYILLNTFLAHFACWFIIDNPLFFLNREFAEPGIWPPRQLLSELLECVPTHKKDEWIGQTLRSLEPNLQANGHSSIITYNGILSRTTIFYKNAAHSFIRIARPLLKFSGEGAIAKRLRDLTDIMATAGNLVMKLRQQNYDVKSLSYDSQYMNSLSFSRESHITEPHPALRLKQDDTSLDGLEIDFVIQPAILACWFDEHTNEKREKVWAKAVVWAGRYEQIRTKRRDGAKCVNPSNSKGAPGVTQPAVDKRTDELPTPTKRSHSTNRVESPQRERLSAVVIHNGNAPHKAQSKDSIDPGESASSMKALPTQPTSNQPRNSLEMPSRPIDGLESEAIDACPIGKELPNPAASYGAMSASLSKPNSQTSDKSKCPLQQNAMSAGQSGDVSMSDEVGGSDDELLFQDHAKKNNMPRYGASSKYHV